jgi:hypothetical protein
MPESPQATNAGRTFRVPMTARALVILVTSCSLAAGCTRAMFKPPAGPGAPAPDAAAAWAEATDGCHGLRSYAGVLRASGRVGGARLWPVSIDVAVLADQSIYLGATAAGRSLFLLAGTGGSATLWLRDEQRTVTAPPADILKPSSAFLDARRSARCSHGLRGRIVRHDHGRAPWRCARD